MGLPRPPEPFHRVYSPPEPPATARRSRFLTVLLAVLSFAGAAVAVFVLVPGGDSGERDAAGPGNPPVSSPAVPPPVTPSAGGTSTGAATPRPSATGQGRVYSTLPKACDSVSQATLRRLVPGASARPDSNTTFATCTYSVGGAETRWLQVSTRLYGGVGDSNPAAEAHRLFGVQWATAKSATQERTVTLNRDAALGDEAYRWFKIDETYPAAIGEVATRIGNVVITVSYSEQTKSKNNLDSYRQRCLTRAAEAAREVLNDFH